MVLKIDPARFSATPGADLYDDVECRREIHLTDGGVYDNMGLETVWNRYDTVLVSDAGTPAISDPGYRLIRACLNRDLEVEVLPGPSAVITALVASGLPADRWRFEGFLPRRAGELERVLHSAETVVALESPRRLPESLAALAALAPDRPAAVCRELTKLHEEVARGPLGELARRFHDDVRGEIVVVIAPAQSRAAGPDLAFAVDALRRLVQSGARPRAAASVVAALTGTRANDLYRALTGRDPRE